MDGIHSRNEAGIITRALGDEIRRVRDHNGWTRAELVDRMASDIHVQTLATYEQGVRQCTVVRLIEICRALGVAAPDVLGLALQRAELDLKLIGVRVDVRAIARDERNEYAAIQDWAGRRLSVDQDGAGVVYLDRTAIREMAVILGYTEEQLYAYLVKFIPDYAPRWRSQGKA